MREVFGPGTRLGHVLTPLMSLHSFLIEQTRLIVFHHKVVLVERVNRRLVTRRNHIRKRIDIYERSLTSAHGSLSIRPYRLAPVRLLTAASILLDNLTLQDLLALS